VSQLSLMIPGIDEIDAAASRLIEFAGEARVFLFRGEMGAGKTTLIKALCRKLGSSDDFSSPTFSIVNEYESAQGKIFHFDLFRLKHAGELLDIGIDEYLNSGSYCFFEWPELVQDLVVPPYLRIDITVEGESRLVHVVKR
jgi:tRNA threonylcarbamoyladenosine biosynthesis protein TsaE